MGTLRPKERKPFSQSFQIPRYPQPNSFLPGSHTTMERKLRSNERLLYARAFHTPSRHRGLLGERPELQATPFFPGHRPSQQESEEVTLSASHIEPRQGITQPLWVVQPTRYALLSTRPNPGLNCPIFRTPEPEAPHEAGIWKRLWCHRSLKSITYQLYDSGQLLLLLQASVPSL